MGRFDKFFQKVKEVADPVIVPGDETQIPESPRNWATEKLNSVLPEDYQIPMQTLAESKQQLIDLPQTMAGATMGSVATPKRFSNLISHDQVMKHPEMIKFLEGKAAFKANNPHPSQYDTAKQALINKIRAGN